MKLPRFTLGMIAGVSLSAALGISVYYFVYFLIPDGIYESPSISFYMLEDDPNYDVYLRLEDPEYWRSLSESAQSAAKEYCVRNNISADVIVHCYGSPQQYEIYYSTGEYTSLHHLFKRGEIESVIVAHVAATYHSALVPIIGGEKSGTGHPASRSELDLHDSQKPRPEAEGGSR